MAQAKRDQNYKTTILGVSSVDLTTPTLVKVNPVTGAMLVDAGSITGVASIAADGETPLTGHITLSAGDGISLTQVDQNIEIAATGSGTVTSVTATAPITSSGGTTPVISTSMATNKLIGRGTAGTGVMEEITLGTNLSLAGTTLNAVGGTPGGSDTQVQFNDSSSFGGDAGFTYNKITDSVTVVGQISVGTQLVPDANDGASLGLSGTAFSDLFLASGGVINWAAADATITHSAGLLTTNVPLTITGVVTGNGFAPTDTAATGNRLYLPAVNTLGFSINGTGEVQLTSTALSPISDGGNSLGTTALGWQNLFGNTGFVLNIENSDWVATHTAGILTVGTGDLRVTNAGTNAASAVTVGGTQTLTNKTLTAPVINTGTIGTSLVPTSDDGAPLGDTTHNFSDLFLASGAVINYANSNVVLTHTSGILTMGTGDFRVTNAGTNAASVVTTAGTQTLTNKTIDVSQLSGQVSLANGGTGANLVDPNADRILFWDDSAGAVTFLTAGTGLTITTTTLTASGTPGGSTTQVQFNDGGSFGGDSAFVWNKTTNVLTVPNITTPSGSTNASGTDLSISTGDGGATSGDGGLLDITSGSAQGGGNGGDVSIGGGEGVGAAKTGGNIFISSGIGSSSAVQGYAILKTQSSWTAPSAGDILLAANTNLYKLAHGLVHAILSTASVASSDKTFTFPNATGTFVLDDNTTTLTNKRVNSRVVSAASYTTDTGTSLSVATCDLFVITAQAGALKFNNPGGTPTEGQQLTIRIKDNGTARALTYDTQFRAMGTPLPSTTVLSKTMYMRLYFNSTDTKWDLLAVGQEA